MADANIIARWIGKPVRDGVQQTIRDVGGLGTALKGVGQAAGLALGVTGALGAAVAFRQGVKGMIQDLAATDRLVDTISKRTFFSGAMKNRIDEITRSFRYMGVADTELTAALDELISKTNNVEESLSHANILVDLSAKLHGDWKRAVDLAAAATAGQTERIGELVPELRNVIREMKVIPGSAEAIALSWKSIIDYAGGSQESETGTFRGALNQAKVGLQELNEAMAEVATGSSEKGGIIEKAIRAVGFVANAMADALREDNKQLREFLKHQKDIQTQGRYVLEQNPDRPGYILSYRPPATQINRELEKAVMEGLTNAQDVAMGRAPGAGGAGGASPYYPDPWELPMPDIVPRLPTRGLPDLSGLPFYAGRRGYGPIRGGMMDLVDMPGHEGTGNKWAEEAIKAMKDRSQIIASTLGNAVGEGFVQGARNGMDGLRKVIEEQAWSAVGQFISAAVTVGLGGTAGGLGGAILGSLGIGGSVGGGGFSGDGRGMVDYGGVRRAQMRAAQWRTARLG